MSLSVNSVFEVQTGGNDTNGGGFVTGAAGTDYSLVAGKRTGGDVTNISTTDGVGNGTTTFTSATGNFTSALIGNIISLSGGTGTLTQTWRQVTAVGSSISITLDATVAAGTGITMNIGGALASPGMAGGVGLVSGNIIYIKAGTYTIASATINIATGCFSSSLAILHIEGYQTTRGDLGTQPLLQASGISTFVIVTISGGDASCANIGIDGASLTSSQGFNVRGICYKCYGLNCTNSAFIENSNILYINCYATGCSTASAFLSGNFINCIAYDNTITGFTIANKIAVRCISDSNSGASSDGFNLTGTANAMALNCVAYNNGRDGFRIADDTQAIQNCIAESNGVSSGTGTGINNTNQDGCILVNNATFGNQTAGITVGTGKGNLNIGAVTGSASFFTNAASQDFSLNNTAGAGAVARATGYPGVLPVGGTGFLDIGVLQHADPAGSGGGMRLAGTGGLAAG